MRIEDKIGGIFVDIQEQIDIPEQKEKRKKALAKERAEEVVKYCFKGRNINILDVSHEIDEKTGKEKRSYVVTLSYVSPQEKELYIFAKNEEEAKQIADETVKFYLGGQVVEYKSVTKLENKNKFQVILLYMLPDEISMENEEANTKKLTINN